MICVYCISHVPALLCLDIPGYEGRNVLLIAFLIFVVQSSDVVQYVWGKLLGRTRIAPNVSPSKTVEGLIGGALSAVLIGASLSWMTPFTPWQAGLLSFVIVVLGFFGGLVMSAIKRDRGVKDWGHLIAGHGGLTDRLELGDLLRPDLLPPRPPLVVDHMTEGSRRPLASRDTGWARAVTRRLAATAITPNQISAAGMAFAALAGLAFWGAGAGRGLVRALLPDPRRRGLPDAPPLQPVRRPGRGRGRPRAPRTAPSGTRLPTACRTR